MAQKRFSNNNINDNAPQKIQLSKQKVLQEQ